ncbi:MAG: hypothetical protein OXE99_09535, partial [Cellvibrionales bacterium]|nr:hypothetical protein [Cellvibrionales bacterium]
MVDYLYFFRSSYSILPFVFLLHIHSINAEDYQGSQAYHQNQPFNVSVNTATGTFNFTYPLIHIQGRINPLKLNLTYQFNAIGMFGFPKGWRLDIDYISDKTAYLGGKQWLIDDLWHDETPDEPPYASGLKYFNQHGSKFKDLGVANPIPEHKNATYQYRLDHKDGSTKYFSHQGLLVYEIDRFGNSIEYIYEAPIAELGKARLDSIIDNYGNIYKFTYEPGVLILTYPDGRLQKIYFGPEGVKTIINPKDQRVDITYIKRMGQTLVNSIESPSGLITELAYDSIPYKEGEKQKQLPVVIEFRQTDLLDNRIHHQVHYEYKKGNNYTGYPEYGMSKSADSLIDSDNQNYRYSVRVIETDGNYLQPVIHQKVYEYNFLHLPVEVRTFKDGKHYLRTSYQYDIDPFKYSRSTNYDKPTLVENSIWDDANNQWLPSDKVTYQYDYYGNKLSTYHYVFHRDKQDWLLTHSEDTEYFTYAYSLVSRSTKTDNLSGKSIVKKFELAPDKKTHKQLEISAKYRWHEKDWRPWQRKVMSFDDYGRKIEETLMWSDNGHDGVQKTTKKTHYSFDKNHALLTVQHVSHQGRTWTIILDTRNGNRQKIITPKGEQTCYEYNEIGQLTKRIDPAGNAITSDYFTYAQNGMNAVIHSSPLGDKRRLIHDASGRKIASQFYSQGQYIDSHRNVWSAFGKPLSDIDRFGNETTYTYDDQKRLVKSIDPWGNSTQLIYDDLSLITQTIINGQIYKTTKKIPWLRQRINQQYPFLQESNTSGIFVEKTITRDAFNKSIEESFSLVEPTAGIRSDTVITRKQYDASHNLIASETIGFDGIHLDKTMHYDLFNNLTSFDKVMRTHDDKTTHTSYQYRYDADNLLIQESTPHGLDLSPLVTTFEYDKNGKEIAKIMPDGHKICHGYDNRGLLISSQWYRDDKPYHLSHMYDADGRLIQTIDSDDYKIHYRYNESGLLTHLYAPDNRSQIYEYDRFMRKIVQENPDGSQLHYRYDQKDKGNLSAIVHKNGLVMFGYGKDNNGIHGKLIEMSRDFSGTGKTISQYRYDAFGRRASVQSVNAISKASFEVSYEYNPKGELLRQMTQLKQTDQPPDSYGIEYAYDSLHRVISEQHHQLSDKNPTLNHHFAYRYDGNNNLIQEQHIDSNGNKTVYDRVYNTIDQLVTIRSSKHDKPLTITYDTNGRLTKDHLESNYKYDDASFLLGIEKASGENLHFHYWPNGLLGHLLSKEHQDFYYDENKRVQSIFSQGEWQSLLRHRDEIIGTILPTHINQIDRVNQSSGLRLDLHNLDLSYSQYHYQAYGNLFESSDDKEDFALFPFEFTWNQELNFSGLTYLRHRFYNSLLRQFLT